MRTAPRQLGSICYSCANITRNRNALLFASRTGASDSSRSLQMFPIERPRGLRWNSAVTRTVTGNQQALTSIDEVNVSRATVGQITNPSELASIAEECRGKSFAVNSCKPSQRATKAALQSCLEAATALHPQLKRAETQSKASASRLASLGAERTGSQLPIDAHLSDAVNRISHSAYSIITDENVEMTPEALELYVQIQAQLGRPESLPSVLSLYANKPKPVLKGGQIQRIAQKPTASSRAIEIGIADMALQTAIQAKNLDAALGVIESSYRAPAFKRQKLIKHGTAPAMGLATLPFGIFGISTAYAAYWQNTMDISTATGIAVAGLSGYFAVVGSLGLIAKLSNKDQMKRVTWMPGTPLRYRWLREEERAALDKVACAWGFREPWRHGEEMGTDWEGLREYLGYRQMILDRVEFMDGMN